MGILEKLLETNVDKLKEIEKVEREIPRLTKIFEEPFVVTCYPITEEQIKHVMEISKEGNTRANFVLEGCRLEGKKLSDKMVLEWLGVHSGMDAVKTLFRAGEIQGIYDVINELSGYGDDAVKEIKN